MYVIQATNHEERVASTPEVNQIWKFQDQPKKWGSTDLEGIEGARCLWSGRWDRTIRTSERRDHDVSCLSEDMSQDQAS